MQIFDRINKNKNLAIALGYFDGVHLGHQAVIMSAVNYANQNNLKSAVITFKDHPCCYFYGVCPKYILSRVDRQKQLEALGIDYLYELDFNEELCSLSAHEYLENILIKNFSPISISTGFNHYFGANKSGNADLLKKSAKDYNYKYFEIQPQKINDEIISSTEIRKLLHSGDISKANKMIGRNFVISGKIIHGQKLGRTIGFKTANIDYPSEIVDIPYGVYEVRTQFGRGIANFGVRPTVSNVKKTILETHILNFDKNIYGEVLHIEFIKMIRSEQKFTSMDALKNQIILDIKSI